MDVELCEWGFEWCVMLRWGIPTEIDHHSDKDATNTDDSEIFPLETFSDLSPEK